MTTLKNSILTCLFLCCAFAAQHATAQERTILLNGKWQYGVNRNYTATAEVPGVTADPTTMTNDKSWYKRTLTLPAGKWKYATLELKGARFMPEIFLNDKSIQQQPGGMAPLFFELNSTELTPGNTVTIEIALTPLKNVPITDASFIPPADQWRSNVAACLWDDVVLHLHDSTSIDRIIPFVDLDKKEITIKYDLRSKKRTPPNGKCLIEIIDNKGSVKIRKQASFNGLQGTVSLGYDQQLRPWSPASPNIYQLRLIIKDQHNNTSDERSQSFAIKKMEIKNKQFYLNNKPCKLGGGTVVWHRWIRTNEGRILGYDTAWFVTNIIKRLKAHGANYLRFHLGKPPEKFLDLCDRYGLIVQYEWSFFHGMPASEQSLVEQYRNWLDVAVRHPSVSLIHPYNETEGHQLETVWTALNKLLPQYPPFILEDRDLIHIHKYWWSIFENLGLYYDSASQFPKAIMVDEFGGNYLDSANNVGGYKTLKESFLRFLGRGHTAATRLQLQNSANGKVAEYWRRIGAAGIAPFCILGSNDDGNHWFNGSLLNPHPQPKPLWNTLTAAWSPISVSMEIWDKNFVPNQHLTLPLYVFNDTETAQQCKIRITIKDKNNKICHLSSVICHLSLFSKKQITQTLNLPGKQGEYTLSAELINKPATVTHPVISEWKIYVHNAIIPPAVAKASITTFPDETELLQLGKQLKLPLQVYAPGTKTSLLITSNTTWQKIANGNSQIQQQLQQCIEQGTSILMLDVGLQLQPQPTTELLMASLQQAPKVKNPQIKEYQLFGGIRMAFTEVAEPESHIHPDRNDSSLWSNIPRQATWLWNGSRGGLIVPAADLSFTGLNERAFLKQWQTKGADTDLIKAGSNYYAYLLQGFYAFSTKDNDEQVTKTLKNKLQFLVEDAPALAATINPLTPIQTINLSQEYTYAKKGMAENLTPLVNAGKNLTRCPVVKIDFGNNKGKLIVSQLITAGRLHNTMQNSASLYSLRYDEITVQFVLNMLNEIL